MGLKCVCSCVELLNLVLFVMKLLYCSAETYLLYISKSYSLFIHIFVISVLLYFPFQCSFLKHYFNFRIFSFSYSWSGTWSSKFVFPELLHWFKGLKFSLFHDSLLFSRPCVISNERQYFGNWWNVVYFCIVVFKIIILEICFSFLCLYRKRREEMKTVIVNPWKLQSIAKRNRMMKYHCLKMILRKVGI